MPTYPQHAKLDSVQPLSQACGEFIDWLATKGIYLAEQWAGDGYEDLRHTRKPITDLLAKFFGIDLNALEAEKRQMVREITEVAAQATSGIHGR